MPDSERLCPQCGSRFAPSVSFCPKDGSSLETQGDPYIGQELLGQFKIEQLIGAGGMGSVYRAHQRGVERKVAIKVLHAELTENPDAVRRFQREAQVAAAIDHPNVVRVLLYGELPDGNGYIAMEYLEGISLAEVVREAGALPLARAVHIAAQICAGVGEAHAHGVVHRDIKPENVLLVQRGADPDFVKVLDFGVAKLLHGEGVSTQTGLVFGTAHYISPEGAQGEPTDARSDVYSIAVLLFQMLSGERLFEGPTPVSIMLKHIQDPAPDVRTRSQAMNVPEPIASVVARALSKKPALRYENAKLFREAIMRAAAVAGVDMSSSSIRIPRATKSQISSALVHASDRPTAPEISMSGTVTISGLPARRSRSPWKKIVLAFVVSAVLVFGSIAMFKSATVHVQSEELSALIAQADAALSREAIDAPPESSVLHYLAEIERRAPSDPNIARLRAEAVRHLRESAARALAEDLLDEAKRDYGRALAIDPNDAASQDGLAHVAARQTEPEQPIEEPRTTTETKRTHVHPASGQKTRSTRRSGTTATTSTRTNSAETSSTQGETTSNPAPTSSEPATQTPPVLEQPAPIDWEMPE